MIEALVVDLGGVAARFMPERRLQAVASLAGLSTDEVQARWFDSGLEAQAERGAFAKGKIARLLQESLSAPCEAHQLIEAWALAFELDAAVLDLVEVSPIPAVLLTNNGPMLDLCVDGPLGRLASSFSHIICSWHVGASKPEVLAYQRVADRLGRRPERLLLLDDNLANVEAAVACGWNARRATNAVDCQDAMSEFGI